MSNFKNVSGDERSCSHGLRGETLVAPGQVLQVPDDEAIPELKDDEGNVVRPAQSFADGYRNQPGIWEEQGAKAAKQAEPEEVE